MSKRARPKAERSLGILLRGPGKPRKTPERTGIALIKLETRVAKPENLANFTMDTRKTREKSGKALIKLRTRVGKLEKVEKGTRRNVWKSLGNIPKILELYCENSEQG